MSRLALKIPPPVVALVFGTGMWLVARYTPGFAISASVRFSVAAVLALGGVAFALSGMASFRKADTTIDPRKPDECSQLVVSGVYRKSRNPMYVGLLLLLLAWAAVLANPYALLLLPIFVAYMVRFQIRFEEFALEEKFGASYRDYLRTVRRWL